MNIAIFGHKISADARPYVEVLYEELEKMNAQIFVFDTLRKFMQQHCNVDMQFKGWKTHKDLVKLNINYLITIGGDGTILKAACHIRDSGIPILGINTGRLGFLANVARHEVKDVIGDLLENRFTFNERSLIHLDVRQGGKKKNIKLDFALNEVTIARKDTTSMVSIHAWINDEYLTTYWADGLIIATPTGSTGYSLSCGGPIIMPGSENFVITPIAPHNLNVRPFVIPNHYKIKLRVEAREKHFLTSLDSRIHTFPIETELTIEKANFTVRLIETPNQVFTKTLRDKLFWGKDLRN